MRKHVLHDMITRYVQNYGIIKGKSNSPFIKIRVKLQDKISFSTTCINKHIFKCIFLHRSIDVIKRYQIGNDNAR